MPKLPARLVALLGALVLVASLPAVAGAASNGLANDVLRDAFAAKSIRKALQPVIGMETFSAGPRNAVKLR